MGQAYTCMHLLGDITISINLVLSYSGVDIGTGGPGREPLPNHLMVAGQEHVWDAGAAAAVLQQLRHGIPAATHGHAKGFSNAGLQPRFA